MNRVEISGGLTRDPDVRFLPSGLMVVQLTVAVNGAHWSSEKQMQVVNTAYVAVELMGTQAQSFMDLGFQRGDEVFVFGEIRQSSWEKKDGTKEQKTRVHGLWFQPLRVKTLQVEHAPLPREKEPF